MNLKDIIKEAPEIKTETVTRENISLTDFLNYAKRSGYLVEDHIEHWLKEYSALKESI